mmetsp:Transcript_6440/g.14089  ORF Transcript_6440/g.14089 Transcript_6440/m.14089 type:complete len:203 (+) Transcript_6440:597-1205(+)
MPHSLQTTRSAASTSMESGGADSCGCRESAFSAGGGCEPSSSMMSSRAPASPMWLPSKNKLVRARGGPCTWRPRDMSLAPVSVMAQTPKSNTDTELPPNAAPSAAAPSSDTAVCRSTMVCSPHGTCRIAATAFAASQVTALSPARLRYTNGTAGASVLMPDRTAKHIAMTSASERGCEDLELLPPRMSTSSPLCCWPSARFA